VEFLHQNNFTHLVEHKVHGTMSTIRKTLAFSLLGVFAPAAADICSNLEAATSTSGILTKPLSLAYETEIQNYWSAACAGLRPTCMMFPTSADEVADIVKSLHQTDDLFAVKSGGHMPNNGFSSIQGGLLISTKKLNNIVAYDAESQTAKVGPGLTWAEAQKGLDGTGMSLVGGRLGGVGIGGYILGGKLFVFLT
jgi:FAD/FMN-containing dehydrogenase